MKYSFFPYFLLLLFTFPILTLSSDPSDLSIPDPLYTMDYVLSALDGLKSAQFVPGSVDCANNTKYFLLDAMHTQTNYRLKAPAANGDVREDLIFNTTNTISGYLPDTIYYCYFIPHTART